VAKLALLALPILVALTALEYRVRRVPTSLSVKRALIEEHQRNVEVVILGDSHALNGIDPSAFGRPAINLANGAQSIYYDVRILSPYLDRLPALRLVVLQLSYFSLRYRMSESPEAWRMFYYEQSFGIPYEADAPSGFDPRRWSFLLALGNEHVRALLLSGFRNELGDDARGWGPLQRPSAGSEVVIDDDTGRARVLQHDATTRAENLACNLRDLQDLIRRLRGRDVEVVLLTSPVDRYYAAHMNPVIYQELVRQTTVLSSGTGAVFHDYMTDPRFSLDDFINDDHLNVVGARKFSEILCREVVCPRLAATAPAGG
jgi:hypothetical protein